jgi:RNA polymerase II subunit A C-terminal domain phosphatase SSU72
MPGKTPDKPNVYQFGTPYDDMYKDLFYKDKTLYTANGLLQMLDRNRKIKTAPQKFQENDQPFDVVITCEERCFDAAMEDMLTRPRSTARPVHLINVEIIDNHEQALIGGQWILQLVKMIQNSKDVDSEMDGILTEFQARTRANIQYTLSFMYPFFGNAWRERGDGGWIFFMSDSSELLTPSTTSFLGKQRKGIHSLMRCIATQERDRTQIRYLYGRSPCSWQILHL